MGDTRWPAIDTLGKSRHGREREKPGACAGLLSLLLRLDRRGDHYEFGSNG